MKHELYAIMKRICHTMALQELQLKHSEQLSGKLTYNSVLYLEIIAAYPGVYTASKLASLLKVAKPSLTQKINELEEAGYLYKKQCAHDKRIQYLYTTDQIFDLDYYKGVDDKVEHALLDVYTKEEVSHFLEMMHFVCRKYEEEVGVIHDFKD